MVPTHLFQLGNYLIDLASSTDITRHSMKRIDNQVRQFLRKKALLNFSSLGFSLLRLHLVLGFFSSSPSFPPLPHSVCRFPLHARRLLHQLQEQLELHYRILDFLAASLRNASESLVSTAQSHRFSSVVLHRLLQPFSAYFCVLPTLSYNGSLAPIAILNVSMLAK